jgi:hypothetical protein
LLLSLFALASYGCARSPALNDLAKDCGRLSVGVLDFPGTPVSVLAPLTSPLVLVCPRTCVFDFEFAVVFELTWFLN